MEQGSLALSKDQTPQSKMEDLRALLRQRGVPLLHPAEVAEATSARESEEIRRSPLRGQPLGTLGVISGARSSGKTSLALEEVARVTRQGALAAVVDATGWLFPPSLALQGGRMDRVLVLRPARSKTTARKAVWAAEQVLRSGIFALTVLIEPRRLTGSALRRLQLAAERSGVRGLIVRQDANAVGMVTLRLHVEPVHPREKPSSKIAAPPRRCRVRISSRGPGGVAPTRRAEVALGS